MEGFPEHGTDEEKQSWLKVKAMEIWRYNMLTSDQSAEYRQRENAHVWEYQCKKKAQSTIPPSQTVPPHPLPLMILPTHRKR